jgi:hypothetical protein
LGAKVYGKVIKENNMPCRDYEADRQYDYEVKAQNDRLARIACKAMNELVKSGYADFLLLKDDEVREWWDKHQEADRKAREAAAKKSHLAKVKREALAKLSDEEKAVLGIKK